MSRRVYVISEAVAFVRQRLPAEIASRLDNAKVQRILEWEVYYLQGSGPWATQDTIAGGDDEAIDFVSRRESGSATGSTTAARTWQRCCVSRPTTCSPSVRWAPR